VSFVSELGRQSLAEVLRRGGYRTAAFVSATPLAPTTGVNAGFETFEAPHNSARGSSLRADERNEAVLAWLEREALKPGPFFLWVHYFDPHEPSNPRPPYDRRYRTDATQRAWIRARGIDPAALEARYAHSARVRAHFLRNDPNRREDAAEEPLRVTLESIAELMNRYDGELRFLDDQIGVLLTALRKVGRYEDALLVLVADHGQSLGENAWLGHGTITNVNTFVPMILRLPRGLVPQPQRLTTLVSLADLMPTLLGRFELPGSELLLGQFEGEDLLSGHFVRGSALVERTSDELADGETGPQFALLSEHWKFVHRPKGRDELYDLAGAGEFVDVSGDHPEVAARLRTEIASLLARRPALLERETAVDEELLRSLDELGYGGEDE
jgi:arylsulfatase A-like enzyme